MILTERQEKELQNALKEMIYGDILIKARNGKTTIEVHESKRIGEDGVEKIKTGVTTLSEVFRVTQEA